MKKAIGWMGALLVLFSSPVSFAAQQEMIVKLKRPSFLEERAERKLLGGKLLLVRADPFELKASPDVEWAEPNVGIHGLMGSGLPGSVDRHAWGIKQISADQNWSEGRTGKNVIVAVLDSGVANHPALSKNLMKGWNFISGTDNASDDHGHGTHCAGIVAGERIGVAPDAKILPVKILDSNLSGTAANVVDGIHYALKQGAKVILSSWFADGYSQAIYDAIDEARAAGVFFVTGAGNEGSDNDLTPVYPASFDLSNVISVAATTPDDTVTAASNWGNSVHVAAPGLNIYSSVLNGKYDTFSGTSMAAAHVAGVVAVMAQSAIKDIRTKIIASCDRKPNIRVQSRGRVNAYNATHSAP